MPQPSASEEWCVFIGHEYIYGTCSKLSNIFYAPNFEKVEGAYIALGLSVRPSFCASVTKIKLQF